MAVGTVHRIFFCNKPSPKVLKASWNPLVSLQLALGRSLLEALKKPRKNKCECRRRFGTSNREGYERMTRSRESKGAGFVLMNSFVYFSVELKPQGRHNVGVDFWLFHKSFVAAKKAHFRMTKTDQYAFHSAQWGQELLTREGVARLRQIKAFGGNGGGRSG